MIFFPLISPESHWASHLLASALLCLVVKTKKSTLKYCIRKTGFYPHLPSSTTQYLRNLSWFLVQELFFIWTTDQKMILVVTFLEVRSLKWSLGAALLLKVTSCAWVVVSSIIFKVSNPASSVLSNLSLFLCLPSLTPTQLIPSHKDPYNYPGTTRIMQNNLLFSKSLTCSHLQSSMLHSIHRFWWSGHGQLLGVSSAYHTWEQTKIH